MDGDQDMISRGFADHIKRWLADSGLVARVIIPYRKIFCVVLLAEGQSRKWVVFWQPSNTGHNDKTRVVRFYDWNSIPTRYQRHLKDTVDRWTSKPK
jgi:hypothetical protein